MAKKESVRKKRRWIAPVVILVILAILGGGAGFGYSIYLNSQKPVDVSDTEMRKVVIEQGSSTGDIAAVLESAGLIRNTTLFKLYSKLEHFDGQYRAGTYGLSRAMSTLEIIETIIAGVSADVKRFTIPEGYNTLQTMKALVEAGLVTEAEFMDEVENGEFDYAFLEGTPAGPERLEGFLYPETYEVYADATAHDIIDRMLSQFDKLFKPEYYDRAGEMEMSVRDVVVMGSIIERESKSADERPLMAGVFYNRLEIDMLLQSCATIQYILGEPKEFLTEADTRIESPYNTYLHKGLPPGPVCSPRMASVEAALYPDENDYIYFVLSEKLDGTHNFSADYSKFERDKAAYKKAVAERGS